MKILVTGSNGMLAYDLIPILKQKYEVIGFDKKLLDITDIYNISDILEKEKPNIIINCAAYTNVEKSEDKGKLLNYKINTLGVYNLAKICNKFDINCIHISTDYVFDGTKKEGYMPNDEPNPINQYGMAKYLGEQLLQKEIKNAIIIRTSWLYGGGKQFKNFVNTMLTLSETNNKIKIVGDQFGAPTYTKDLSTYILNIIGDIDKYKGELMHYSNKTEGFGITWYDFAKEIFNILGKDIILYKCDSSEFITKAIRPKYSKLIDNSNILINKRTEGLKEYLSLLITNEG